MYAQLLMMTLVFNADPCIGKCIDLGVPTACQARRSQSDDAGHAPAQGCGQQSMSSVARRTIRVVAGQLGVPEASVTLATRIDALYPDDLDMVEIMMSLEVEFSCSIPDEALEKATTVNDYAVVVCRILAESAKKSDGPDARHLTTRRADQFKEHSSSKVVAQSKPARSQRLRLDVEKRAAAIEKVAALLGQFLGENINAKMDAAKELTKMGHSAGDAEADLRDALKSDDLSTRWTACDLLAAIGATSDETIGALIAAFGDPNMEVHVHAELAIAKIGARAVPSLVNATRHEDHMVRIRALMSLRDIVRETNALLPGVRGCFEKATSDPIKDIQAFSKKAMREVGWTP